MPKLNVFAPKMYRDEILAKLRQAAQTWLLREGFDADQIQRKVFRDIGETSQGKVIPASTLDFLASRPGQTKTTPNTYFVHCQASLGVVETARNWRNYDRSPELLAPYFPSQGAAFVRTHLSAHIDAFLMNHSKQSDAYVRVGKHLMRWLILPLGAANSWEKTYLEALHINLHEIYIPGTFQEIDAENEGNE